MRSYIQGVDNNKYRFSQKEKDVETMYSYFGARYYDPDLGRWLSVDPLADRYPGLSSYNYCLNNPLIYIDPKGEAVWTSGIYEKNEDGSYKNPKLVKAFEEFASSEEGIDFLSQFAAKGQIIAGHEYTQAGKYDLQGFNLAYDHPEGIYGHPNAWAVTYHMDKDIHIRLSDKYARSANYFDMAVTLIHESFIHADQYPADYMDDKEYNYSNLPYYAASGNPQHLAVRRNPGRFGTDGLSILLKMIRKDKNIKKNRKEVSNEMWYFND